MALEQNTDTTGRVETKFSYYNLVLKAWCMQRKPELCCDKVVEGVIIQRVHGRR